VNSVTSNYLVIDDMKQDLQLNRADRVLQVALVIITFIGSPALDPSIRLIGLLMVIGALLPSIVSQKTRIPGIAVLLGLLLLFQFFAILRNNQISQVTVFMLVSLYFVPILLAVVASNTSFAGRVLIRSTIIWLGLIQSAIAIAQGFWGIFGFWNWSGTGVLSRSNNLVSGLPRVPGSMGHGIVLGFICSLALIMLIESKSFARKYKILLPIILMGGILLSGSRSALIVLLISFVLAFTFGRISLTMSTLRSSITLVVFAVLIVFGNLFDNPIARSLEGTGSLYFRVDSWSYFQPLTARSIFEILFGSGLGSFSDLRAWGMLNDTFGAVDNNLLYLFAVGGTTALVIILAMVGRSILAGDVITRTSLFFIFGMFISFDVSDWFFAQAVMVTICCLPSNEPEDEATHKSSVLNSRSHKNLILAGGVKNLDMLNIKRSYVE